MASGGLCYDGRSYLEPFYGIFFGVLFLFVFFDILNQMPFCFYFGAPEMFCLSRGYNRLPSARVDDDRMCEKTCVKNVLKPMKRWAKVLAIILMAGGGLINGCGSNLQTFSCRLVSCWKWCRNVSLFPTCKTLTRVLIQTWDRSRRCLTEGLRSRNSLRCWVGFRCSDCVGHSTRITHFFLKTPQRTHSVLCGNILFMTSVCHLSVCQFSSKQTKRWNTFREAPSPSPPDFSLNTESGWRMNPSGSSVTVWSINAGRRPGWNHEKKRRSFIVRCAAGYISILQIDVAALWRAGVIHQLE